MRNVVDLLKRLARDEEGAALIEYSILIAVIAVAVIGLAIGVGQWVTARWNGLCTALNGSGIGTCASGAGT
jgi:pilus assembly protein Flp/PilA